MAKLGYSDGPEPDGNFFGPTRPEGP